ncbi:MAG: hypothetical protein HYV97_03695 [Bdellovibrio sp.]|nr:hypothetical protein [Bdellovibrio sp.]
MEPVTSTAATKTVGTFVMKKLGNLFITKFAHWRAESFFEQFCRDLRMEEILLLPENEFNERIEEIFENEKRQEVFYEHLRMVVMSASKEIGPRCMAFMTAKCHIEQRIASEIEDRVFLACEQMNDRELIKFMECFKNAENEARGKGQNQDSFLSIYSEMASSMLIASNLSQRPTWIIRLINSGLIKEYQSISSIGQSGPPGAPAIQNITFHRSFTVDSSIKWFVDLIDRFAPLVGSL